MAEILNKIYYLKDYKNRYRIIESIIVYYIHYVDQLDYSFITEIPLKITIIFNIVRRSRYGYTNLAKIILYIDVTL